MIAKAKSQYLNFLRTASLTVFSTSLDCRACFAVFDMSSKWNLNFDEMRRHLSLWCSVTGMWALLCENLVMEQ